MIWRPDFQIRLAAMLLSLMVAPALVVAQSTLPYPPHEELGTALATLDIESLLSYYSDILKFISKSDYDAAKAWIAKYNFTYQPESLRSLFSSYTNQINSTNSQVQYAQGLINEISLLIDQNYPQEANQKLREASIAVAKALILLNAVQNTTSAVGDELGITNSPTGSPEKASYDDLQSSLQDLRDMLNYFLSFILSYKAMITQINGSETVVNPNGTVAILNRTSITLALNVSEALIGDYVGFSGSLATYGTALLNRNVTMLMNGEPVANVSTGLGTYSSELQLPYLYEHKAVLFALYSPTGNDSLLYLPSISQPANLTLLFNTTNVEIASPDIAYPGLPFTFIGKVISKEGVPLSNRTTSIYLNNTLLGNTISSVSGFFNLTTMIDPLSKIGNYPFSVEVTPQDTFAGGFENRTLKIDKMPINVTLQLPSYAFLPAKFTISGHVIADSIPINNANVTISIGSYSMQAITMNGSFSADIDLPSALMPIANQRVSVSLLPRESWYATSHISVTITMVNPLTLGAIFLAIIFTLYLFFFRFKLFRIWELYKDGGKIEPNERLRKYLDAVSLRFSIASEIYACLLTLAEMVLCFSGEPCLAKQMPPSPTESKKAPTHGRP